MIVIADDITGAAEIAGIAFEAGHPVRLVCAPATATAANAITVVATDTRSMTEVDAINQTRHIASRLTGHHIFKKTDSALRGHVVAELTTLLQTTGYRRAVYLPANPSKGRTISQGVYYINGTPIHQTDFSFDPEFPARTSSLRERFPNAEGHGILMPDATTPDDIRHVVSQYDDGHTLFAGAADLFAAIITRQSVPHDRPTSGLSDKPSVPMGHASTLILCGSTQSKPLHLGIPTAPMPRQVYEGSDDLSAWDTTAYDTGHSLILTIPHTHRTGKAVAVHLRTVMARMACRLVARQRPDHLVIEGGATAWATLQALGWNEFLIEHQLAPGVVQMRAACGTLVTLKPGSYPWGNLFSSHCC